MAMVTYKEFDISELADVIAIYEKVGWIAYLQDKNKLFSAFENSLYLLGAFDDNQLIGFARVIGDGEHIVLVQDLIITSEYQKFGMKELEQYSMIGYVR